MTIQQKLPNAAGAGKDVWVDPGRDIGHVFPIYVEWAARLSVQHNPHLKEGIIRRAKQYHEFFEAVKALETRTLKDAMEKSGLDKPAEYKGADILDKQVLHVVLGAFFEGARSSFDPTSGGGFFNFNRVYEYFETLFGDTEKTN